MTPPSYRPCKEQRFENLLQQYAVSSQYYAPRGKERMVFLGEQIAHAHLHYNDRLVGVIGDAGSGKSSLIHGMFPGLELSNDDDVLQSGKIMQVRSLPEDFAAASTFHLDMRFQMAFTQMFEIVDFVQQALDRGRRVVIEHFNLLYPALGVNADVLIGIGEEIIVARPSLFGPLPESIYQLVHKSLKFRKKAHSAEELTIQVLTEEMGFSMDDFFSSDIRNGFVLRFYAKGDIDFEYLERRVHELIREGLSISYLDETHIRVGKREVFCSGPRIHVKNTQEIGNFSLVKKFVYDPKNHTYCLIGLLDSDTNNIENRNTIYFLTRHE